MDYRLARTVQGCLASGHSASEQSGPPDLRQDEGSLQGQEQSPHRRQQNRQDSSKVFICYSLVM
jgi:hypothetical protein